MDKRKIVDFATKKLFTILGKSRRQRNYLIKSVCKAGEIYGRTFITYKERYKESNYKKIIKDFTTIKEKCAIIIQGPIRYEDNFTVETVKLYKKYYPNILVIVSTWEGLNEDIEMKLKEVGAIVLKNKEPVLTGLGNVNYQIISTKAGIAYAKKHKSKFILKTRSDQRIYKMYFLEYFLSLIEEFPLNGKVTKQNKRIITGPSLINGNMMKPFMISDFLYFGCIEDIEKLFDKELDDTINMSVEEREKWIRELKDKVNISEFYDKTAPELHIIRNFADSVMSEKTDLSIYSYWNFVKNHIICLGWNDIDLYWPKYGIYNETNRIATIDNENNILESYCWEFSNWLLLYNSKIEYKKEYETFCDKREGEYK